MNGGMFDVGEKPAYDIPLLADLPEPNGFTAVSTFSGCGGSSLGLRRAGWTIPYAVEFIPAAGDTYQANAPSTFVDRRDIREITAGDILNRLGLDVGELDLFEGSPPCSSFSTANMSPDSRFGSMKVKPYSDGVKQTTDDLFDEWLRILVDLRPRMFLAENVPTLTAPGLAGDYFATIMHRLEAAGYTTDFRVYNSKDFGTATARRRLLITGIRSDLSTYAPSKPQASDWEYTLRDALATAPPNPPDELEHAQMAGYAVEGEWNKIGQGEYSAKYYQLYRCLYDVPVPTITATGSESGSASITHPDECRKFTATEVAWISGFPADVVLTGTPRQRYERIGRAVTPPLYAAVGAAFARDLERYGA